MIFTAVTKGFEKCTLIERFGLKDYNYSTYKMSVKNKMSCKTENDIMMNGTKGRFLSRASP